MTLTNGNGGGTQRVVPNYSQTVLCADLLRKNGTTTNGIYVYRAEWSDARVAAECGLTAVNVANIRRQVCGQIRTKREAKAETMENRMCDLENRVASLEAKWKAFES